MAYNLGKVQGIEVYRNDAVVVRQGNAPVADPVPRGIITEWSKAARRRLAFLALNTHVDFVTMITLTYPEKYETDGREVKRALHAFLAWLRRDIGRFSYLWFLEFQERGAPHIHILHNRSLPRARDNRRAFYFRVSSAWYRLVGSDDSKHLSAGTRCERVRRQDGLRRYAVKYAMKMEQKTVPPDYQNVGRLWGASRDCKPQPEGFVRATEDDIRGTLQSWEWKPDDARPLYRVLYNQAARFRHHLDG